MPQKVNPDTLELTRGKSARVIGDLQTLIVLIKGLPLAYNRDLQEDKPPLFDAFDTVEACLELAVPIVDGAELNRASIESRLEYGYLDATTLMEALIKQGMPQRRAHHLVGEYVAIASNRGVPLSALTDEEFLGPCPDLAQGGGLGALRAVLGVRQAVQAYQSYGSSAPNEVRKQVHSWKERLH
jgi:argininosuccinate lyase